MKYTTSAQDLFTSLYKTTAKCIAGITLLQSIAFAGTIPQTYRVEVADYWNSNKVQQILIDTYKKKDPKNYTDLVESINNAANSLRVKIRTTNGKTVEFKLPNENTYRPILTDQDVVGGIDNIVQELDSEEETTGFEYKPLPLPSPEPTPSPAPQTPPSYSDSRPKIPLDVPGPEYDSRLNNTEKSPEEHRTRINNAVPIILGGTILYLILRGRGSSRSNQAPARGSIGSGSGGGGGSGSGTSPGFNPNNHIGPGDTR